MKNPTTTSFSTSCLASPAMVLAKAYIQANLEKPPRIQEIAKHICQSESSFKRNFKSTYGLSVYQFIQYARVQKAKQLLDTGRYNVRQVAYQIGYANPSHFSKAFRKYIHFNPKEYLQSRTTMKINLPRLGW